MTKVPPEPTAVSLFSSGGIGDLSIRAAGFRLLASNELLVDRHSLFESNFPDVSAHTGDIRVVKAKLIADVRRQLKGRALTMLYATPPCQGMSKNGRGKLLNAVRAGKKPPLDERNQLIIPVVQVIKELQPEIVVLENVPEMAHTVILDSAGAPINILEYIDRELKSYSAKAEVVEFADFGVPQCRQRLITVLSRQERVTNWLQRVGSLIPRPTHSKDSAEGTLPWNTVGDAIADFQPLDAQSPASAVSALEFHRVPLLDPMKHWWVANTPAERSAFDNQCCKCGFDGNKTHSARRNSIGVNRASIDTPLYCQRCGELLPRPSVEKDGERRIMRGFTSAYKRMSATKPASALTRNLSYACSDNKLHPTQNRVLSLAEALRIHTVDQYDYRWVQPDGRKVSDKTVREIIGESIPPAGFEPIIRHLLAIYRGEKEVEEMWGPLFALTSQSAQT